MRSFFDPPPSMFRLETRIERALAELRAAGLELLDAAEAGKQRAAALESLAREPFVTPPPRERRARIPGLDIRRFIPRRT